MGEEETVMQLLMPSLCLGLSGLREGGCAHMCAWSKFARVDPFRITAAGNSLEVIVPLHCDVLPEQGMDHIYAA